MRSSHTARTLAALPQTAATRGRRKPEAPPCALAATPVVVRGDGLVCATLPLTAPLPSLANARLHWAAKAKLVAAQRAAVALALNPHRAALAALGLPCEVTLTRIAPRALDDDNAAGALKASRDQVALLLGVDDRDPRVTWRVAQAKGPAALRVEVRRG